MALPSATAEAVRDVLIAQGFKQSTAVEGFDTSDAGRRHKQFFLIGPRLTDTIDVSQQAHSKWEMGVQFGWQPFKTGDVDRFRFEMVDAVSDLHAAWIADTNINADEFKVNSSDPTFNVENGSWEMLIVVSFTVARSVSA